MPAWSIKNSVRTPLLLMAIVEMTILFSSVYVAALVVFSSLDECERSIGPLVPKAIGIAGIFFFSLIAMGLYQFHQRIYYREAVARIMVGVAIGALVLIAVSYAFPAITISQEIAGVAIPYALILLLIVRYYFVRTVDENVFRHRTLIYGAGGRAASISDMRRRADRRGFQIVGQIPAPGDTIVQHRELLDPGDKSITIIAQEYGADEVVVAMDDRRGNLPIRDLLDAKLKGIDVIDLLEFLERETGKIRVDLVNPGWLIFSSGFRITPLRRFTSRVVDVLVSGGMFLFVWPVMLLVAIAIKLEDGLRAPVFYRQQRVGLGGESFPVLKFRSMKVNAEADGKAVWASKDDCRVTRVGRFLRKSRLDEFPQLLNVLLGQMSLVGPRPERPEFVRELQKKIPYYAERHAVRPGITGWAQLKYSYGSSEDDALEKLQYDLYYVKNQKLILDFVIILQTVEVVLWGKGAR